jgi:hypothetical protein
MEASSPLAATAWRDSPMVPPPPHFHDTVYTPPAGQGARPISPLRLLIVVQNLVGPESS